MTVLQAILVLGVVPVVVYVGIALLVALPKLAREPRYRPGQPWTYPPLWWTANPDAAGPPAPASSRSGERGGAHGSW